MKDGDNPRRTWLLWCPPALLPLRLHAHTHTHPRVPLPLSPRTSHTFTPTPSPSTPPTCPAPVLSLIPAHRPCPHAARSIRLHLPRALQSSRRPSLRRHRCFCYHNNHVAPAATSEPCCRASASPSRTAPGGLLDGLACVPRCVPARDSFGSRSAPIGQGLVCPRGEGGRATCPTC